MSSGFREHHRKTTRRKEWLVFPHFPNCMPFMVTISSNVLLLDRRHSFAVTLRGQNVQAWIGTILGPAIERIQDAQICWQSFWDRKGVLLDFMEKGTTIIAASYCATLERLRVAIQQQSCFCTITSAQLGPPPSPHQRRDYNTKTLAALQVDTFGTSTI